MFSFKFTLIGSCWSQSSSIICLQNLKVCVADREKSLSRGFLQKCPCLPYQSIEGKTRGIRLLCRKEHDGEGRGSSGQGYLKLANLGNRGERYLVTNDCTFCWAGNIYPCFVTIIVRYLDKLMNQTWTVMSGNTVMNRRGICVVCTYILVCVYVCSYTLACICIYIHIYTLTHIYTLEIQYIKERNAPQDILYVI